MYNSLTINLYITLIIRSIITIFYIKNISPPTTRRRDILHYFFKRLAIKDAPTTRMIGKRSITFTNNVLP